jgi:hypothetical protein
MKEVFSAEISIYSRRDFSFIFSLIYDDFLMDFIEKLQGEISSFLMEMGHFHILLCEEMIFPLPSGKMMCKCPIRNFIRENDQRCI